MGLGLGGFVDGIVLHQILQWHHMLTDTWDHPMTTVAGLEANTLADGFFHLATWVLVATAMCSPSVHGSGASWLHLGVGTSGCCSPDGACSTSLRA